jgi:hypothetical protein
VNRLASSSFLCRLQTAFLALPTLCCGCPCQHWACRATLWQIFWTTQSRRQTSDRRPCSRPSATAVSCFASTACASGRADQSWFACRVTCSLVHAPEWLCCERCMLPPSTRQQVRAWCVAGRESLAAEAHIDRGLLTVVWEDTPGLQARRSLLLAVSYRQAIAVVQGLPAIIQMYPHHWVSYSPIAVHTGPLHLMLHESAATGVLSSRRMAAGDTGQKPGCCLRWGDVAACNRRPHPSSSSQGFARTQDLHKCGATLFRLLGYQALAWAACSALDTCMRASLCLVQGNDEAVCVPVCCRYAAATRCHTLSMPGCHSLSSSGLQRTPSSTCAVSLASSQTAGVCPALLQASHAVESLHVNNGLLRRHTINTTAVCRPVT